MDWKALIIHQNLDIFFCSGTEQRAAQTILWVTSKYILQTQSSPPYNDTQRGSIAFSEPNSSSLWICYCRAMALWEPNMKQQNCRWYVLGWLKTTVAWRVITLGWHLQSWQSLEVLAPHEADQVVQLQQEEHPCGAWPRSAGLAREDWGRKKCPSGWVANSWPWDRKVGGNWRNGMSSFKKI